MTATSSIHVELITLCETSRECIWLRSVIGHIQEELGINTIINSLTIIYEDNTDCIEQVSEGFIKGNRTKHIAPKLFFAHDLMKYKLVKVKQVQSSENLADLFTTCLPLKRLEQLAHKIGMCHLQDIC